MEYSDLVAYYKDRLLERYKDILEQPERQKTLELINTADSETLRRVLEILDQAAK